MPTSARWSAAAAVAVFALPALLTALLLGLSWPYLAPVVELLSAAACVAPLCFRRRDHFRVACAAAGAIVASVWLPTLLVFTVLCLGIGDLLGLLARFAAVAASIAALIAAFQRAKGTEHGRPAAFVGWTASALALASWACAAVQ
ncbi:hypothetical protein [Kitasatospora sp. NPDC101183]|uniref:hypothetical protein n=1 Tax=Kitasatospora sp. NPDC101183 TaxID=3364100 RepID=UPI0037F872F1